MKLKLRMYAEILLSEVQPLLATLSRAKLVYGDEEGAKKDMEEAWKVLDDLSDVESRVRAAYYSVAADYYKARFRKPASIQCPMVC